MSASTVAIGWARGQAAWGEAAACLVGWARRRYPENHIGLCPEHLHPMLGNLEADLEPGTITEPAEPILHSCAAEANAELVRRIFSAWGA